MERNPKRILIIAAVTCALVALAFYGYRQSKEYLRGPVITITEPENGTSVAVPLITVAGRAENAAFLTLNGRQIFTDEQGNFREKLLLEEGYNILAINAKDRFGRAVRETLQLVYKPQHDTHDTNSPSE